ncbi:hypothetical protein DXG03_005622 [Asterophora parasitica]|uniref:Heme peroxidase n=1 Tax=Asterophora parasitica TaxID=117018 RepID=A0A9P7KF82_9AGAR|nr:hypothetical protein DXG03_005622 [Asterophora parasitica]
MSSVLSPDAKDSVSTNQQALLSGPPQSFLSKALARIPKFKLFGTKPVDKGPVLPPVSPKIVKTFTSLGTAGLLRSPAEIDDKQKTFQDGMTYLASNPSDKDRTKLNEAAVALLHNPQRTRSTFPLATRTQTPREQYPFSRLLEQHAPTLSPDPEQVFDTLLQSSGFREHPNGLNALFTALATVVSLCLVRVNERKPEFNETSPSLDLSPLYGVDDSECDLIRAKDGTGMLSPDCFYDDRATFLPPAVSVLLIIWNRNHNYIARRLLLNNEGKRWSNPSEQEASDGPISARFLTQDNEIFKIARAINCVQFKNVVTEDFFKVLAGLPHAGPGPKLDLLIDLKQSEKGKGHDSTVEFSLVYSLWSSMASKRDIESFDAAVAAVAEERGTSGPVSNIVPSTFQNMILDSALKNRNRRYWNFAGDSDSRFDDNDLARVLLDATESAAGSAQARGIASCFRPREILAIQRARSWKAGSLNEFRKVLGLKQHKSFVEWNSDPVIASAAEAVYGSIDSLELYPGLLAEASILTSGLSLGYTLTYALLVDLVTLVRNDPQFTTEFNPKILTHWGHKHCITAPENGAYNTWLPTLLQRHLPRNYQYDNIYSLFPLTCPATSELILRQQLQSLDGTYTVERPRIQVIQVAETRQAISHVFNNAAKYSTPYADDFKALSNGYGFILGFDDTQLHDRDLIMSLFALIPDKGAVSRYGDDFGKMATKFIREHSTKTNGHMSIDIVRDVINATCTRWVCETLCGISFKGKGGSAQVDELTTRHEEFAALYASVFRNVDPEHAWATRLRALKTAKKLTKDIKEGLPIPKNKANPYLFEESFRAFYKWISRVRAEISETGIPLPQHSALTFLDRIVKSNRTQAFRLGELTQHGHLEGLIKLKESAGFPPSANEILLREELLEERRVIANILGLAVVTSVNYAQACTGAVDFYLDDRRSAERQEIIRLSNLSPADARREGANAKIMGYIREAQRLGQPLGLWRNVEEDDVIPQAHGLCSIAVRKGERVFADFTKAHTDARDFQNPLEIDPSRKTPTIQGSGMHKCPAIGFVDQTMPELFKAIFRLKNLRRDGKAGRLEHIFSHPAPLRSDPKVFLDSTGEMSHFPRSLSLIVSRTIVYKDAADTLPEQYDYSDDDGAKESPSKPKSKKKWHTRFGEKTNKIRKLVDRFSYTLGFLLLIYLCIYIILAIVSRIIPRRRIFSKRPVVSDADVQRQVIACPAPYKLVHGYEIVAFIPGEDGVTPEPVEYNLNGKNAHRLSLVAIGNRDLRMGVYVDNVLRGMTTRIVRNSTESCGEVINDCLAKKFSAGLVVIPAGNHTVRIQWEGNGLTSNATEEIDMELDWSQIPQRRFKWQKQLCA